MAAVDLTPGRRYDLWLNDAENPSVSLRLPMIGYSLPAGGDKVAFREYGGGRIRMISRRGSRVVLQADLIATDDETTLQLERWSKRVLMVRGPQLGLKFFGGYALPARSSLGVVRRHNLSLTITSISREEGV